MDKSLRYIKGVGEKKAKYFEKLGAVTVNGLLSILPRRYENLGNIVEIENISHFRGEKVSIYATVSKPVTETRIKGGQTLTTVFAQDETGLTKIVYFNNKFIKNMIKQGETYLFYGKIAQTGMPQLTNPDFYKEVSEGNRLLPVYPLVSGLNQKFVRRVMRDAFESAQVTETLPLPIREKYGLCEIKDAYEWVHFPQNYKEINIARRRFIFEELLYYSLGLQMLKHRKKSVASVTVTGFPSEFLDAHGFEPTDAQKCAMTEIYRDLKSGIAMNRLLQGDVGSGKTLVAGQCAYCIIKSGGQAAIMVPTGVLANQHYKYFDKMLTPLGVRVELLTSANSASSKREIKRKLAMNEIDLIIGTHAVLQEDVKFHNLGLMITDEQHRFGVMQRSTLAGKGKGVHVLVMSATPIPRTLALMMWGDLDLSVIDAMPHGRQKIKTYLVDYSFEERLNAFIRKQIDSRGRVYVVCPLIEDEEQSDSKSAVLRHKQLCKEFGESRVGLVHGKMKPDKKDGVMRAFAEGEIDILVSTTVIEVGINVPEATLMIIENAERFGLSQLHQLRGRVGRGNRQSYCVLVSNSTSDTSAQRLDFFVHNTDGFKIAEKDLELRGPGNFFGKDQHGLAGLRVADMQSDIQTLQSASQCAKELLYDGKQLQEYPELRQKVLCLFETKGEIFN